MKKLKELLDPKYVKICCYAAATALIAFALGLLLYHSQGFFLRAWHLFTAVMTPLIYGALLAYLLSPLVKRVENLLLHLPFLQKKPAFCEKLAILATLITILAALVLLLILGIFFIYRKIGLIDFEQVKTFLVSVQSEIESFFAMVQERIGEMGLSFGSLGSSVSSVVGGISSFFSRAVFAIIFCVYFLLDRVRISRYWKRALRLIAGEDMNSRVWQLAGEADRVFSGYIRGQFVDASIVFVLISVTMLVAGVPYAFVIGLLTGIGNLIPYMGGVAGILSISVACLSSLNIEKLIVGLICLAVVMFVDGNIINPRLLSNNISIHPLLVVAALIAGSAVGGFAGMLIAVPVAALIKLQFDRYLRELDADSSEASSKTAEAVSVPEGEAKPSPRKKQTKQKRRR